MSRTRKVSPGRLALLALCAAGAAGLPGRPAQAAVLTPTKTADTRDGACDADCSLREAVLAANAAPGTDVVLLGPGTYTLTIAGDEDAAAAGDLDVGGSLVLIGAGAGATVIDGGGIDRLFELGPGDELEVVGVTLRNGQAASGGGAVFNQGALTLTRSVVAGSRTAGFGGGILSADGSTLTISQSTISGNTAEGGGGGIALRGRMTLTNSTVTGNRSLAGFGGGIYFFSEKEAVVANATIAGNRAAQRGGGIFVETSAFIGTNVAELRNTVLAGNQAPVEPDCSGSGFSGGFNLVGDGNGCIDFSAAKNDLEGTAASPLDPRLGPLVAAGGPTPTHALLPGSPAIDAGNPDGGAGACAATDQRGLPRPGGLRCDIGAFEVVNGCVTGGSTLCLNDRRFRVTARFATSQGLAGDGQAVALTDETGTFFFFDPANVEVVVKVIDACALPPGRFWVFLAGLTNVAVELRVEDTATGTIKTYTNPQGRVFRTRLDTNAFATCTYEEP